MVALRGGTHKEATIAICPCKPSFSPKAFVSKAPQAARDWWGTEQTSPTATFLSLAWAHKA